MQLLSLDVHGGTQEHEIISIFDKAQSILDFADNPSATVFVFLDEVNTSCFMGVLVSTSTCLRRHYLYLTKYCVVHRMKPYVIELFTVGDCMTVYRFLQL